jgi:hypothetical protein
LGTAGSGCSRESDQPGGDDKEIGEGLKLVFHRGEIQALSALLRPAVARLRRAENLVPYA